MAKKLGRNVNINGVTYLAGTSPEKDIADQITNEKAWAADPDAPERTAAPESTEPAPNASAEEVAAAQTATDATAARKAAAKKTAKPGS